MSQIGNVYGQGLYALAKEESLQAVILRELQLLDEAFRQEPTYQKLLSVPDLSKQERCQILDQAFRGKVQPYVLNFLKLLTEKGYIRHFSQCYSAFKALYNEENGILPVRAVSAVALTEDQKRRLTEKLSHLTGKTVELDCRVDGSCLGGLRLDYAGCRVDGTVQSRLDAIGRRLQNTVL